jgi:hypothetical protein
MPDPKHTATSADHASHDLLLVAEAVDRGGRLPTPLAGCPDCAALHADLVAIAAAAPSSAIPTRPRDFTLTSADAQRLRAPAWRRWLAGIGSPRDTMTRPLAIGLTTLGLAGLLVSTIPGTIPGFGGAASQDILSTVGAPIGGAAAPSSAPSTAPLEAPAAEGAPEVAGAAPSDAVAPSDAAALATDGQPSATTVDEQLFSGRDTGSGEEGVQRSSTGDAPASTAPGLAVTAESTGPSTVVILAAASLLVGVGLFGLRWSARRLGDG